MTDIEYDIIDLLYFVMTFEELKAELEMEEEPLKTHLTALLEKGWLKCLLINDEQTLIEFGKYQQNYKKYHYLATKEGLLAHNSQL